ncbi:hypothetical protein D0Y65_006298 [Glycine soja]|uniref:DUF659 domain-containing protein n=1 Tax=Glycine soja TaxID=3848 RepID=A0A445L805_GLYSO|nr:hypothetical protein D0Y65_006298 [Glycine soja]
MLELVASHGKGFKQPSYHEIRVKYLKQQVENINDNLEEHRRNWKKIGCSIMTDALTDRRRTILNFLLNSPKGIVFLKYIDASEICKTSKAIFKMMDEVVAKVREEAIFKMIGEVVEEANYKAAGDLLMHRRKNLYWTACAVHCIDLMLEDFENKLPLHQETIASERMVGGIDKIAKIDAQIENSKSKSKSFGSLIAQRTLQTKTPAQWWSLMVHTKKRNHLQKTMNDVVFVMSNSRLNKKKDVRKSKNFKIDDVSSDDEWIVENEANSDLNALDEDILVELGEDANGGGISGASMDDLEVPPIVDDDEGGGDAINE